MAVVTASTAQLSHRKDALRRMIADRFGDLTQLTTTDHGINDGSTLVDALNVNAGSEHYNGRQILITSGDYSGHKARVTSTNDSTGSLTFTPLASGRIETGITVDVFNRRGIGFTIAEYDRALNNAIHDAFPLGVIDAIQTLSTGVTTTADITTITVPVGFYDIYAVEWEDDVDVWREVPKATRTNGFGWKARPDGILEIVGLPQDDTEDNTLRLRGYKRQDALTSESDECLLPKEWIVARAAYHLALGSVMRGQEYGALAQQFQKEADLLRTRLRTLRHSNSERVRSY